MQRRTLWFLSLLTAAAALASGCNDLGSCDDPARGRKTVLAGGVVMYAGQAITLRACAGCHSSSATGAARNGAPAGLDFDLTPVAAGNPIMADGGVIGVSVDEEQLAGLRARQRKVFDDREDIWEQVDDGLMPPDGVGRPYFQLVASISTLVFGAGGTCPMGERLGPFGGAEKEELRQWLACGTPIVETTSSQLPYLAPAANAPESERAAGAYAYAGTVGYQFPACAEETMPGGDGGVEGGTSEVTFDQVYQRVLTSETYFCNLCHGADGMGDFSMGETADSAYMALLGANMQGAANHCPTNPGNYVVPGDPDASYLLLKVDRMATGRCGTEMPPGSGITASDLQLVRSWIQAGAPR